MAVRALLLSECKGVVLAFEDNNPDRLYLRATRDDEEDAFKLMKSGSYYMIDTRAFFDHRGLDYRTHSVLYDLVHSQINGEDYYRMISRNGSVRKPMTGEEA